MPSTARLSDAIDQARRSDRYADSEWMSADTAPAEPSWTVVKAAKHGSAEKRVLFNGRYWMTRDAVAYWRPVPATEAPVTALLESPRGLGIIEGIEVIELEALPQDHEIFALAEIARLELDVEVVRLFEAGPAASGATSGRVLAVSENFAAQAFGEAGVMIHRQADLQRNLQAGENATVDYQGGRATIYNGAYFDVNIRAPFLTKEQIGWMRMHMIEALSGSPKNVDDKEMIKEALRYALDKTAQHFVIQKDNLTSADIKLSVSDPLAQLQVERAQAAAQAAQVDQQAGSRLQIEAAR